jgi:uncharacterized protein YcnI
VLSVGHGCEGSSTTGLRISIPDAVTAVTPTRNPQWEVEKEVVTLDPPVTDSHGNTVTERVASVTYTTDTPLPDGYRDTVELSLQLPDAEGSSLAFPVIQTCQEGESAWIEVPAEGQDPEELELPAPAFVLTAAEAGGHSAMTSTTSGDLSSSARGDAPAAVSSAADAGGTGGTGVTSVIALVLAAVGIALGGVALAGQRRRT